jgi:hypothetical protein
VPCGIFGGGCGTPVGGGGAGGVGVYGGGGGEGWILLNGAVTDRFDGDCP